MTITSRVANRVRSSRRQVYKRMTFCIPNALVFFKKIQTLPQLTGVIIIQQL